MRTAGCKKSGAHRPCGEARAAVLRAARLPPRGLAKPAERKEVAPAARRRASTHEQAMRDARTAGGRQASRRQERAAPSLAWPPRSVAAARTTQLPDDADDAGRTKDERSRRRTETITPPSPRRLTQTRQDPT